MSHDTITLDTARAVVPWQFPSPYCLFSRVHIDQKKFLQFKSGAGRVAAAYHEHYTRMPWAAYSTVAGPGLYVYIMLPVQELAELDKMEPLDKVMTDVYGPEGLDDLSRFQDAIADMDTSILSGMDARERSVQFGERPPEYLYYVSVSIRPDRMSLFIQLARQVAERNPDLRWFAYGTFAGRSRLHAFAAGSSIAELGLISNVEQLFLASLGAESGTKVLDDIRTSIIDAESSIIRYIGHEGQYLK